MFLKMHIYSYLNKNKINTKSETLRPVSYTLRHLKLNVYNFCIINLMRNHSNYDNLFVKCIYRDNNSYSDRTILNYTGTTLVYRFKIPGLPLLLCEKGPSYGPRQANLVLITYASSEGSGEPAHARSLARTFAARSYKQ